jgi:heat shock protein HslJ
MKHLFLWGGIVSVFGGCAGSGAGVQPGSSIPAAPTAVTQQPAATSPASAGAAPPSAAPTTAAPAPAREVTARDLVGNEYLLVSAKGYASEPQTPTRLGFKEGAVMFTGGCNVCMANYSVNESTLYVENEQCTQRGCDGALEGKDAWLAAFLASSPKLVRSGSKLRLEKDTAALEFADREVADPDRPLVGPTWTIRTFLDDLGQWGFSLQVDPTVEFRKDGTFGVSSGCGTGTGRYKVTDRTLTLSQVTYSTQRCPTGEDERVRRFIEDVLDDGEVHFAIDASRLRLARGEWKLVSHAE